VQEERVHWILLFVGVLAAYIGIAIASIALGIWAISFEEPGAKRQLSFWLSGLFWPLLPLLSRLCSSGSTLRDGRRILPRGILAEAAERSSEDRRVRRFSTIREAKDYLVDRIVAEADREGIPLSEVERKMLYFSETGWTLPDMKKVSAEFDRDYDQGAYERKIGGFAGKIQERDAAQSVQEQQDWDRAVLKLSNSDHYLLVLIDGVQPRRSRAMHWLTVLAAALIFLAIVAVNVWFKQWLRDH
jgi:hypothetical protein